ncbi:MAG: bifunctional phosphoribosyl-AMP cyclohydrolase/phosphoribosyl-ATP diphosphatase HisIE [Chitinophagaceae bacterium]|nr:MAG: bifunctional phosphoribosyl-AMP cyclohydrolase/phosphoribosyl-ATP diphosphatase HisIE [Chitinophagaceae bacterium]
MQVEFSKYTDGLAPAIVQDAQTNKVLMLGFMNEAALNKTLRLNKVTFFSRSKQRLWTKGEASGNFLLLKEVLIDCDKDSLLIKATPQGPTCHSGADTCFNEVNEAPYFLPQLERIIESRLLEQHESSYTHSLMAKGINKVAQKVGEEAVELVIEAKDTNDELFLGEAADLLFHYLLLLKAKNFSLKDVEAVLKNRHKVAKK